MIDTAWRFSVLGDFEVRRAGERVPIRPRKLQLLLVALVMSGNHVVPTHRIEEILWQDRRPASVQNTIYTYVARLRRLLGGEAPIHSHPSGYLIEVDPCRVDVSHFQSLLADAYTAALRGDVTAEHAALTAALQLWRGSALSGLPFAAPIANMARSLEEQRLQACERRASIDVEAGRFEYAIPDMQTILRSHPLRDTAWEMLIRALRGSGRTAQALDAYRTMREMFHAELGVEPNERVQLLYQEILAMDRLVTDTPAAGKNRVCLACGGPQPAL